MMMVANQDLPSWVWLALAWIEEYEDVHSAAETCMKRILDDVPADARTFGRGYVQGFAEATLEIKGS